MQALFAKMRTGQWPSTSLAVLTAAAARFPADYQRIYDYPSDPNAQTTPSLVDFTPSVPLRPSL
jgi:hypothetical protein